MIRQSALAVVFLAVLAIAVAYGSAFLPGGAPGWSAWVMAVGTALALVATMTLGAVRRERLGSLWAPFAFVLVVLIGGFGAALLLPAEGAGSALWLGLPLRAAVVLYGVGLLPLLAVPLSYALTFDHLHLSEADLARVQQAKARRATGATGAAPAAAAPETAEVG